jgi:hypothetical protein
LRVCFRSTKKPEPTNTGEVVRVKVSNQVVITTA